MSGEPSPNGGWTSPQVVSILVAVAGMFVGGLLAFQRDDDTAVRDAITASRLIDQNHEGRISRLEAHVDELREGSRRGRND